MINEPIAEALFVKYFKGGVVIETRRNDDGSFEITRWVHPDGIQKPGEEEIRQALTEYKTRRESDQKAKQEKKKALAAKLGLDKEEIKTLISLIREGPEN